MVIHLLIGTWRAILRQRSPISTTENTIAEFMGVWPSSSRSTQRTWGTEMTANVLGGD